LRKHDCLPQFPVSLSIQLVCSYEYCSIFLCCEQYNNISWDPLVLVDLYYVAYLQRGRRHFREFFVFLQPPILIILIMKIIYSYNLLLSSWSLRQRLKSSMASLNIITIRTKHKGAMYVKRNPINKEKSILSRC
jgi:hypothetical protein